MGVALAVSLDGFDTADRRLARLGGLAKHRLLDEAGQLVEGQTKRRIMSEKTAPDGTPWRPNRAGTSILVRSGALHDDIAHTVAGSEVAIGSNLVYAAIHQVGGAAGRGGAVPIPARPYLGLSAENEAELAELVEDFLGRVLR